MRAVKFGGSSVADADKLRAAGALLAELRARGPVTAVVSAMAGVTDGLLGVARGALGGEQGWRDSLRAIGYRHRSAYRGLAGVVPRAFYDQWAAIERDAEALVHVRSTLGATQTDLAAARFSGWGERLAVRLLAAATEAEGGAGFPVEEAPIQLVTSERSGVDPEPSALATRAWLLPRLAMPVMRGEVPILPGYIARDAEGRLTTLGRNGSDHSAAIIAQALGVTRLTIYSDVAGVYTADPNVVEGARLLATLAYDEAARIARLGAKALHPRAVEPLAPGAIPLELRAAAGPFAPGTDIGSAERLARQRARAATWVVAARPVGDSRCSEVTALRLPPWPADAVDGAQATRAVAALERALPGCAAHVIARDEARLTVPNAHARVTAQAWHAALLERDDEQYETGQNRLAAGA
ncbi:MAG TPA: hypothetical protein VF808_02120 [Ktedonobacterales bacterium]